MRLKQTTKNGTRPSVPVYDSEAVRQTLARAVEIEAQSEGTSLTAAQIEALGQQLGIPLTRIRQALDEVVKARRKTQQSRQIRIAVVPGLLYGFAIFVLFTLFGVQLMQSFPSPFFADIHQLSLTYLPPLLVLVVGWQQREYRLGAIAGLVLSVATLAGFVVGVAVAAMVHPEQTNAIGNRVDGTLLFYVVPMMLFGAFGGLCGRAWQARRARSNR